MHAHVCGPVCVCLQLCVSVCHMWGGGLAGAQRRQPTVLSPQHPYLSRQYLQETDRTHVTLT